MTTHESHIAKWLVVLLRPIHFLIMTFTFRTSIRHRDRLPTDGLMIYAPTHRSMWDTLAVAWLLKGPLRCIANRNDFVGLQGWFMRRMGAFPVDLARPEASALRHSRELVLAGGEPFVLFPEATIYYYPPDQVHPIKPGLAWLALLCAERAGDKPLRIVPIRLNYGDRFLKFRSRIDIVVQPPIDVREYLDRPRKEAIAALTERVQAALGDEVNTSTAERYPEKPDLPRERGDASRASVSTSRASKWIRILDRETRAEIRGLHRIR